MVDPFAVYFQRQLAGEFVETRVCHFWQARRESISLYVRVTFICTTILCALKRYTWNTVEDKIPYIPRIYNTRTNNDFYYQGLGSGNVDQHAALAF